MYGSFLLVWLISVVHVFQKKLKTMQCVPKQKIIKCCFKAALNEQLRENHHKKKKCFKNIQKFYHFFSQKKESLYSELCKQKKIIPFKGTKNDILYSFFSTAGLSASPVSSVSLYTNFFCKKLFFCSGNYYCKLHRMNTPKRHFMKTSAEKNKNKNVTEEGLELKMDSVQTGHSSLDYENRTNDKTENTEEEKQETSTFTDPQKHIYTCFELQRLKEETNFCKINEQGDELSIVLSFHQKEFKLLRKKEERLSSLIARLTLNILKAQKKKDGGIKREKRKREKAAIKPENDTIPDNGENFPDVAEVQNTSSYTNDNKCSDDNKTDGEKGIESEGNIYNIRFYDINEETIDDNEFLKNILHKMKYLTINELKIFLLLNVYDLQQIHISMDIFYNHPIILTNLPLKHLNEYTYYWVDANEPNKVKSSQLFYKPNIDEVSTYLQFVIYNKKHPFIFHISKQMQINYNKYESELISKNEKRFCDFGKTKKMLKDSSTNACDTTDINSDNNNNNISHNDNSKTDKDILRIMSYNILAPIYTNTEYALKYMFTNVDSSFLKTSYRSHLLLNDINFDFDILCLQEVSEYLHNNLFSIFLHENFYSSYFSKNISGNDGCSLFVNKNKFQQIEVRHFKFNEVVKEKELKHVYDEFSSLIENGADNLLSEINTVYQIGIYMHTNKNVIFLIANTHFYFFTLAAHIRILQAYTILSLLQSIKEECEKKYERKVYVVLCGDFNTSFNSEVFKFLEGKNIEKDSEVWAYIKIFKNEYDDLNKYPHLLHEKVPKKPQIGLFLNRQKFLHLYSAYKIEDIAFTNWNNNFIDVLDYIFLSSDFKVRSILKGVDKQDFEKYKGLVSPIHPSDHLSIAAEVEL